MATASKTGSDAAKKDPSLDDLQEQIETLKDDISALLKSGRDYGTAQATKAKETARERALELKSEGERYAAEAGRMAGENAEAALDAIRRQPATAVAIAAGVGFLIGLVASGRRG